MASKIINLIEGGVASEIDMGSVIVSPIKGGVAFVAYASELVMLQKGGVAFEGGVASVLVTTPTKGGMALHLSILWKVWPQQ